ncbi:glycosyltransferase family 2 protein [Methanomethylovorans sp.]|uniref:glycosyltransferase family 2 protein n=1 Tax=Methanomethylovorans sp. TaxID=2758717 RepID=UPI002FDE8B39
MASEIVELDSSYAELSSLDEERKRYGTVCAAKIAVKKIFGLSAYSSSIEDFDPALINTHPNFERSPVHKKTIAAIPAYNEERFIAKVVAGCKPYVDEIVVVNDGSIDATAMIATACGAKVIYHEQNMGYGAAIRTCFETAKNLQATAMVILDADGQHDPLDIQQVLQPILNDEADVSIGSRFICTNKPEIPFYRKIGMKVLDFATNRGGDLKITDTQSGFRAYSSKAIDTIRIDNTSMAAGSEILLQIKERNLRIKEVPITCRYDIEDTSTHNPLVHGVEVLASIIREVEYKHPLFYIGVPGMIIFCAGLLSAGFVLSSYNNRGYVPFGPAILMIILFVVGLLAIFSALNLHAITQLLHKMKT